MKKYLATSLSEFLNENNKIHESQGGHTYLILENDTTVYGYDPPDDDFDSHLDYDTFGSAKTYDYDIEYDGKKYNYEYDDEYDDDNDFTKIFSKSIDDEGRLRIALTNKGENVGDKKEKKKKEKKIFNVGDIITIIERKQGKLPQDAYEFLLTYNKFTVKEINDHNNLYLGFDRIGDDSEKMEKYFFNSNRFELKKDIKNDEDDFFNFNED